MYIKMKNTAPLPSAKNPSRTVPVFLVLILSFITSITSLGCGHVSGYLGFLQRQKNLENDFRGQPRVASLRELFPDKCFLLRGTLAVPGERDEPLLVVVVSDRFQKGEIVTTWTVRSPMSHYTIFVPEGEYHLQIFADLDRDGYFAAHELIGRTAPENPVRVAREQAADGFFVDGPRIALDFNHPRHSALRPETRLVLRSYKWKSLRDEFFDGRYGAMGLYHPMALLDHTQGVLFGLDDLDENKTMVLFVHGIGGTPQDWKYMVEGMDRNQFQPVFFFYPSGLPLDKLGGLLAEEIRNMENAPRYRLHRLVIVAHSMGGLVAWAAIDNLCRQSAPPYLKMFISFSAPYGGVAEARMSADLPALVPSWRDVAPESAFLRQIYQRHLPREVPFYLFYGYEDPSFFRSKEGGDGHIALSSQLDARINRAASKTYGFKSTHTGILKNERPRQEFNRSLAALSSENQTGPGK